MLHGHSRSDASSLLQSRGERATPARKAVLDILLGASSALSHADIDAQTRSRGQPLDRVTLYRVLDWLVSHGLAHRIAAEDRVWRYNVAHDQDHGHAHFRCSGCGQVFCLNELRPAFAVSLPEGFHFQQAELTIQGLCPTCNKP